MSQNGNERKHDESEEVPTFRSLPLNAAATAVPPTYDSSASATDDFMQHLNAASSAGVIASSTFNGDSPPVYRSVQLQSSAPPSAGARDTFRPAGPAAVMRSAQFADAGMPAPPGTGPTMAINGAPKPMFAPAVPVPSFATIGVAPVTKAADSGALVVPRRPAAPFPIERTHFRSVSEPADVVERVTELLKSKSVTSVFKPGKAKWKATFNENYTHNVLRVRLFADTAKRSLIVEFQRRQGDISAFMRLFRSMRSEMANAGFVVDESGNRVNADAFPSPPARPSGVMPASAPLSAEQRRDAVAPLAQMAASERLDTVLEAVRSVAQLTDEQTRAFDENIGAICGVEGFVQLIVNHLTSDSSDVRRAACAALANLSRSDDASSAQIASIEGLATKLVVNVGSGTDITTQRSAAKALARLTRNTAFARVVIQAEQTRIQQLRAMTVEDEHLRIEAAAAFRNLDAATAMAK